MNVNSLEISNELIVTRFRQGIKLSEPDSSEASSLYAIDSLENIMTMKLNFYFINTSSVIIKLNENTVISCGYGCEKKALGKTIHTIATLESANAIIDNDQRVVKSQSNVITEEVLTTKDQQKLVSLSFKYPWYNVNNEIVGIFGCSILYDNPRHMTLPHALMQLINLGLLNKSWGRKKITDVNFPSFYTQQECEIVRLIVRGLNAKAIAKFFGLSPRTIEHKIERIKTKANVKTKSDLIAHFFEIIKNI